MPLLDQSSVRVVSKFSVQYLDILTYSADCLVKPLVICYNNSIHSNASGARKGRDTFERSEKSAHCGDHSGEHVSDDDADGGDSCGMDIRGNAGGSKRHRREPYYLGIG